VTSVLFSDGCSIPSVRCDRKVRNLLGYVGASRFYQSTIPECPGYLQSIEQYDAACAREKRECTSCSQFSPSWNESVSLCVLLAIRQRFLGATWFKSAGLVCRLAGLGCAGLGWAGLGWATPQDEMAVPNVEGLGWAGLGWAGAGLGWAGWWLRGK